MKAILQITLRFLSFLPIQQWLGMGGAVMVALGLVLTLQVDDPRNCITLSAFPGLGGALLIAFLPFVLGGVAMRHASTPSLLFVRPYGRICMLLGAMLAITLVALAIATPILAQEHCLSTFGASKGAQSHALDWFLGAWLFIAAAWMILFAFSASRKLLMAAPSLVIVAWLAGSGVKSFAPDLRMVAGTVSAAWVVFCIWYLRARRIGRPEWTSDRSPLGFGELTMAPLERLSLRAGVGSRSTTLRQILLGSRSVLAQIAAGIFPALVVLAMTTTNDTRGVHFDPANFMFPLTFVSGSLGYMVVRRARYLWLLAGLERGALFRQAEQACLPVVLLTFLAGAAILVLGSLRSRPDQLASLLLLTSTYVALTVALFYFGLALTRGWSGTMVLAGLGAFLVFILIVLVVDLRHDPSITTMAVATAIVSLLAALLRWQALRRWRLLDWRIAQLPRMRGRVA